MSVIQRLDRCDRLLLLLIALWIVLGVPGNYIRIHGAPDGTGRLLLPAIQYAVFVLWSAIAGVIAHSVIRRQRRLANYGFSLQRGGLWSLAAVAVIQTYLVISGRFVPSEGFAFLLMGFGAFMEEVAFRVILFDQLMLLLNGIRARAFWAILASSVLFTAPHLASKSPGQIPGLFIASLILGYLYYKTRSILLPAWVHAVANAGYPGGVLAAALYCALAAADRKTSTSLELSSAPLR